MRVFVAGATGALGIPLARELIARGHDVLALSRDADADKAIAKLGAEPRRGDLFDAAKLARAATGADAMVRVATRIPASGRDKAAWAENDRIRRQGTEAMLEAARFVGAHYLQESIAWVARPPDGAPFDESSPTHPDHIVASAIDAERLAAEADIRTTTLRLGWIYGPDTGHMRAFADMMRGRKLPLVRGGAAPLSFVHVDDVARAFAIAIERKTTGLYHIVDDEPTPTRDFFLGLARRIGAPPPPSAPKLVASLVAGKYVATFLSTPMVTSSALFRKATGWAPEFATVEQGLDDVERAWRAAAPTP